MLPTFRVVHLLLLLTSIVVAQSPQSKPLRAGRRVPARPTPLPSIGVDSDSGRYNAFFRRSFALQVNDAGIEAMKQRAIEGDAGAMIVLGLHYAHYANPKNLDAARSWLQEASARGENLALLALGEIHHDDPAKARHYLQLAADQQIPAAELQLAWRLLDGKGGPQQPEAARAMVLRAANHGHTGAMNVAGSSLLGLKQGRFDEHFEADVRLGAHYLYTASERGDVGAKRLLRAAYRAGVLEDPQPIKPKLDDGAAFVSYMKEFYVDGERGQMLRQALAQSPQSPLATKALEEMVWCYMGNRGSNSFAFLRQTAPPPLAVIEMLLAREPRNPLGILAQLQMRLRPHWKDGPFPKGHVEVSVETEKLTLEGSRVAREAQGMLQMGAAPYGLDPEMAPQRREWLAFELADTAGLGAVISQRRRKQQPLNAQELLTNYMEATGAGRVFEASTVRSTRTGDGYVTDCLYRKPGWLRQRTQYRDSTSVTIFKGKRRYHFDSSSNRWEESVVPYEASANSCINAVDPTMNWSNFGATTWQGKNVWFLDSMNEERTGLFRFYLDKSSYRLVGFGYFCCGSSGSWTDHEYTDFRTIKARIGGTEAAVILPFAYAGSHVITSLEFDVPISDSEFDPLGIP